MAKLGAYYGLCPLIDHRSLLGISQDKENGIVIVTLGKNIAIKFKLSDQKQLYSWRTKDKFSSPIIYDQQHSKYVAVFNDSFIRMWTGDEEFLDKLKKIKFNQQIYSLFYCNEKSYVVFKNGHVNSLKDAIEKRKDVSTDNIINCEFEYILDVLYASFNENTYVGLIVNSKENHYLYWTRFDAQDQQEKGYTIPLQREGVDLRGGFFHIDKVSVSFLSLWSDGRMYSTELKEDASDIGELFTVIESISCKEYVSMISLDQNYIAIYGCNSNEEGALLVIYNIQFKVVQTRQSFKLFTNGAKLRRIDENLFFPVGQNLAVIPFYLDLEQLAALVGSHKVIESNPDPDISIVHKVQYASWGNASSEKEDTDVPKFIDSKVTELIHQGLTKNMIFEILLKDLMESTNVDALEQTVSYFNDIPESALVEVLKLILNLEDNLFKENKNSEFTTFPQKLQPLKRAELLDALFCKSFNETLILPHLRSSLMVDEVLVLLQYVYFLLSNDGHSLPELSHLETERKLIEWSCVLLDASYQKLILTKDEKIFEMLSALKKHIKEELDRSEELHKVASLMHELKRNKSLNKTIHGASLDYCIEEFSL